MHDRVKVSIVVPPQVEPSVAIGVYDAFWAAGVLWNRITGVPESPCFLPELVGTSTEPVKTSTGIAITPHRTLQESPPGRLVIVPTLFISSGRDFGRTNHAMVDWVRSAHENGSQVFSICTGAFLLAEAGLLDHRDATTHWAFADQLKAEYPKTSVHKERVLVAADNSNSIVTCGGAASWMDMILYLIGRFGGPDVAMRLAKIQLYDWHHAGQMPYTRLTTKAQTADRTIHDCQEWLADHYGEADPVGEMVRQSGLPRRSFGRRFLSATGHSPIGYVQRVRIEEAKQLLETTGGTIEKVAQDVGYDDSASFRRLFKRMVGETPAEYRRRQSVSEAARQINHLDSAGLAAAAV